MHWNHRVIRKQTGDGMKYKIHEVYYNEDDVAYLWTVDSVAPEGGTETGLIKDMNMMQSAFLKPILVESEDRKTLLEVRDD